MSVTRTTLSFFGRTVRLQKLLRESACEEVSLLMNLLGILNRLQQARWWVLIESASTPQRLGYPDYSTDVNRTMFERLSAEMNENSGLPQRPGLIRC